MSNADVSYRVSSKFRVTRL